MLSARAPPASKNQQREPQNDGRKLRVLLWPGYAQSTAASIRVAAVPCGPSALARGATALLAGTAARKEFEFLFNLTKV